MVNLDNNHLRIDRFLAIHFLIAVNVGWLVLALINHTVAFQLTLDDKIIQWLQFLFLLASAFYFYRLGRKHAKKDRVIAFGFFVLLFFTVILALEEISWGQRIFDIPTPDFIKSVNVQNEINLHNHEDFQRYRHWLLLLFSCAGLCLICLRERGTPGRLSFFIPPHFLKAAFTLVLISGVFMEIGYLYYYLSPDEIARKFRFAAGRYSEIGELGVCIAAFSYAYERFRKVIGN